MIEMNNQNPVQQTENVFHVIVNTQNKPFTWFNIRSKETAIIVARMIDYMNNGKTIVLDKKDKDYKLLIFIRNIYRKFLRNNTPVDVRINDEVMFSYK
jgi:hypothetical protein